MSPAVWWSTFLVSIFIGLFGDVAMKQAGLQAVRWSWFAAGFAAYSATSIGWFLLLRTRSLSSFGTLYPVANAIGLVVLGTVFFGERPDTRTFVGVLVGLVALALLGR